MSRESRPTTLAGQSLTEMTSTSSKGLADPYTCGFHLPLRAVVYACLTTAGQEVHFVNMVAIFGSDFYGERWLGSIG